MNKTTVTVTVNDTMYNIGHIINMLHSGLDFDMKLSQNVAGEIDTTIVGLQTIDFDEFLVLVEVHSNGESGHFLLDSNKHEGGEFFALEPFDGGYKGFHKLVGERLED
ncbi:hypothetical protein ACQUY5_29285 [Bacillus cereus]|uniref:hypothetical protein n=1 Tax=Bacillus cereus TaxID=1396 RepID=UPI003D184D2B